MYTLFLFFILLIPLVPAYAETFSTYLLAEGESGGVTEIVLDNNETLDLTENVVTVTETTETVGGIDVNLTQETIFVSTTNDIVTLTNTQLPTVVIEIPHLSKISGPTTWDKKLQPQITISSGGNVPSGFQTPTTSILVGSPDVILVFDRAVTITLTGTTGQTAYKLAGSDTWNLISTCTGTFASPNDPPTNGECSITDGIDTKILTFHFTEFAGLSVSTSTTTITTTSTSSSSTGGSGRVGVGPTPGPGSGGSRGGGSIITFYPATTVNVIPAWLTIPVGWWNEGMITDSDFKSIMTHLLDSDIIPTDTPMQPKPLIDLAPSMKHLFSMWTSDRLPESSIIGLIQYYRNMGVW